MYCLIKDILHHKDHYSSVVSLKTPIQIRDGHYILLEQERYSESMYSKTHTYQDTLLVGYKVSFSHLAFLCIYHLFFSNHHNRLNQKEQISYLQREEINMLFVKKIIKNSMNKNL